MVRGVSAGVFVLMIVLVCASAPYSAQEQDDLSAGIDSFSKGNYGEAASRLQQFLKKTPTHIPANLYLAKALINLNRLAEAEPPLKTIISQDPEHVEATNLIGDLYYRLSRWKDALPVYKKIVKGRCPPIKKTELGRIYFALRKFDDAQEIFMETYADADARVMAAEYLGMIALSHRSGATAERYLSEVLETRPEDEEIHEAVAKALFLQGKTIGATTIRRFGERKITFGEPMDRCVPISPVPSSPGDAYVAGGSSALYHALYAIAKKRNDPALFAIVAHSWLDLGQPAFARAAYDRIPEAVRMNADFIGLSIRIAQAEGRHDDVKTAVNTGKTKGALSNEAAVRALIVSGMELRTQGKLPEARRLFLAANEIMPASDAALMAIAEIDEAMGDFAIAKTTYLRLLDFHPDHKLAPRWEAKVAQLTIKMGEK